MTLDRTGFEITDHRIDLESICPLLSLSATVSCRLDQGSMQTSPS